MENQQPAITRASKRFANFSPFIDRFTQPQCHGKKHWHIGHIIWSYGIIRGQWGQGSFCWPYGWNKHLTPECLSERTNVRQEHIPEQPLTVRCFNVQFYRFILTGLVILYIYRIFKKHTAAPMTTPDIKAGNAGKAQLQQQASSVASERKQPFM